MSPGAAEPAARAAPPWRALALLAAAALVVRLAVVFLAPEQMYERGRVPHEELLRGIAAQELLEGPLLPFFDQQVNSFWGGSLLVSLLAVPLFALLGPKLAVLRLVGVGFALASVVLVFLVLDRWRGRRAAWAGAALLALAPPGYAFLSSTTYGTHLEGNALALGLVLAWLRWREAGRTGVRRTLLLGALLGLALWFGTSLLLVVATLALIELCATRPLGLRRWAPALALGCALGLVPWIAYHVANPVQPLSVYDVPLWRHFLIGLERGAALEKLYDFVLSDGPRALWLHGASTAVGPLAARLSLWLLLALCVRAAWIGRAALARELRQGTPRVVALAFLLLFALAYAASSFAVGPRNWVFEVRYFAPLWPFVALATGYALQDLSESGRPQLARGLAAGLPALFALATLAQCRPSEFTRSLEESALSTRLQARAIVLRRGADAEALLTALERLEGRGWSARNLELASEIARGIDYMARRPALPAAAEPGRLAHANALRVLSEQAPERVRALFTPLPQDWQPGGEPQLAPPH